MLKFNVRSERVKQNIKQGDFAKKLGITPQYLCLIEKGEVEPRRDLMLKMAQLLNSDVVTLFFSNEE
ncbi:helix-turn-helix transcriptional regulator [Clostridium perfringens]